MKTQPTKTREQQAAAMIEAVFPDSHSGPVRVVWWDDGGFLADVVEAAADQLGIGFRAADRFPLDLRVGAVDEERVVDGPKVWYIPEGKNRRDWFRDIRETGGEIECSLEELLAELYEVSPWDIFDVERFDKAAREEAAEIIQQRFATGGIPRFDALSEEILTKGDGQLLEHLLREGWPEIDRDTMTVEEVADRIHTKHSVPLEGDKDPEEITETVRRWAVARWLVDAGIDSNLFPSGFGESEHSPLPSILQYRGSTDGAQVYIRNHFWDEVIDNLDDVWIYAECPVDGALDAALWETWQTAFEKQDSETCLERARQRTKVLSIYSENSPWVALWQQAANLAQLQAHFRAWENRDQDENPFKLYADRNHGTWKIDNEVLQLQLTGSPEEALPATHPATDSLAELRNELATSRYRTYLETLAKAVDASMQTDKSLAQHKSVHRWWNDHEEEFKSAGTVAILFIDALRFDLPSSLPAASQSSSR
ncbi:BREX-5 system phosphatase PglZ [Haladaptatus sp. GCM10025707]|uniref:BREX-5 system phosphatase PglZ n=1 Tax=Haladaptatus sp. GCM10025707 TaxID=3252658 RepID=UPI003620722B